MFRPAMRTVMFLALLNGCLQAPRDDEQSLSELFPTESRSLRETTDENWAAAVSPKTLTFPSDHAAHEDYRIEWWYYTGNLVSENGRRFGYQLTFFRTGLHKEITNPSIWAVRDLYTAHFAISDIRNQRHYCFQRNNRRGIGQAGAETKRYEVWNGDWKVWLTGESHRLQGAESNVAIDLTLSPTRLPVLHGNQGLSQKGATVGNASYYYSYTRLPTAGTVRIGEQTFTVHGDSWMDHEFSTSFLEPGQVGWDWLAIQLENNVDLMLYRMRRVDGTTDSFSAGSLIDEAGQTTHLSASDYQMTPLKTWESTETGAIYPLYWEVEIPSLGYKLNIRPAFENQEMATQDTTGISYWEGAIEVSGHGSSGEVAGRGYMELTGYIGQGLGSLLE